MIFKNGTVLTDKFVFEKADIQVQNGLITAVGSVDSQPGEETVDCTGQFLLPGFIETHFHGALGVDCADGKPEAFALFSDYMAKKGVTSFIPALISSPDEVTDAYIRNGLAFMKQEPPGASMAGMYLEGPFISKKYKGAHDETVLQNPDAGKIRRWQEMAEGNIRKIVIAPELEGAEKAIKQAVDLGITVELGHSGATYEQGLAGIEWGASLATHIFNAMPSLHHRNPGLTASLLTDERVTCELIADFGHVAPAMCRLVYKTKGAEGIDLISDSLSVAGLPEGEYAFSDGRPFTLKDGLCRLQDGTIAGSSSAITDGVRHMIQLGVPVAEAVRMASGNPARTMKLNDRGSLAVGKRGDITLWNKDKTLLATYVCGKKIQNGETK